MSEDYGIEIMRDMSFMTDLGKAFEKHAQMDPKGISVGIDYFDMDKGEILERNLFRLKADTSYAGKLDAINGVFRSFGLPERDVKIIFSEVFLQKALEQKSMEIGKILYAQFKDGVECIPEITHGSDGDVWYADLFFEFKDGNIFKDAIKTSDLPFRPFPISYGDGRQTHYQVNFTWGAQRKPLWD